MESARKILLMGLSQDDLAVYRDNSVLQGNPLKQTPIQIGDKENAWIQEHVDTTEQAERHATHSATWLWRKGEASKAISPSHCCLTQTNNRRNPRNAIITEVNMLDPEYIYHYAIAF